MAAYKFIPADAHIVKPPDLYSSQIEPKFCNCALRIERRATPKCKRHYQRPMQGPETF